MSNAEVKAAKHGVKLPPRDTVADWIERNLPGAFTADANEYVMTHLVEIDLAKGEREARDANFVLRIDLANLLTLLKTLTIGKVTTQIGPLTQVLSAEQGVPTSAELIGWAIEGERAQLTLRLKIEDPTDHQGAFVLREAIEGRERDMLWSLGDGWLGPVK
jgi:hypothetical protein